MAFYTIEKMALPWILSGDPRKWSMTKFDLKCSSIIKLNSNGYMVAAEILYGKALSKGDEMWCWGRILVHLVFICLLFFR